MTQKAKCTSVVKIQPIKIVTASEYLHTTILRYSSLSLYQALLCSCMVRFYSISPVIQGYSLNKRLLPAWNASFTLLRAKVSSSWHCKVLAIAILSPIYYKYWAKRRKKKVDNKDFGVISTPFLNTL